MHKNKILLINPPCNLFQWPIENYAPLGIRYITSFLKENGFDATMFNADWMLHKTFDNLFSHNRHSHIDANRVCWDKIGDIIKKVSPDILGISIVTPAYNSALKIARIAKEINPNITVIAGGVHPTVMPVEVLNDHFFDVVVIGEGEHTMFDLANNLPDKKSLYNIPGICFKDEQGKVVFTKPRGLIENLDMLSFPEREFLEYDGKIKIKKSGVITTTRGCCYHCTFCSRRSVAGDKIRYRSPGNVIDEIVYLNNKYGIDRFAFQDDTFGVKHSHVEEICNMILSSNLKILWGCQTRVGILNDKLLRLMKKAGCFHIGIGVESGNIDILKKIKKDISIDQVLKSASSIKKAGIELQCNFIIGYKEETEETLLDTKNLINRIKPDILSTAFLVPHPGSEIFNELSRENRIKSYDWSLYCQETSDLFTRDNISYERLVSFRNQLRKDFFIQVKLKKAFNIKQLIIEVTRDSDHVTLLIEKIKNFIYDFFMLFIVIRVKKKIK